MAASVHVRALRKAAEIVGGRRALAERLGVRLTVLESWLSGKTEVPREPFLRVVALIIDELAPDTPDSDPGDPPPPRVSAARTPHERD